MSPSLPSPAHLPSFLFPHPSYPSLSSSTLFWLSVRGPTVSFELQHRHPATIKLRAAPRHEIFTTQRGHIQSVSVESLVQRFNMKERENMKGLKTKLCLFYHKIAKKHDSVSILLNDVIFWQRRIKKCILFSRTRRKTKKT